VEHADSAAAPRDADADGGVCGARLPLKMALRNPASRAPGDAGLRRSLSLARMLAPAFLAAFFFCSGASAGAGAEAAAAAAATLVRMGRRRRCRRPAAAAVAPRQRRLVVVAVVQVLVLLLGRCRGGGGCCPVAGLVHGLVYGVEQRGREGRLVGVPPRPPRRRSRRPLVLVPPPLHPSRRTN
jgi:hypothetical protein